MDADEAGLLAAVRDDPWDGVPRLAYADWCEEHSQAERAEFIRVQLEQARLREPGYLTVAPIGGADHADHPAGRCVECRLPSRCPWHALAARAQALLDRGTWWAAGPMPSWPTTDDVAFRKHGFAALVERGFVSGVRMPLPEWGRHGKGWVLRHPVTLACASDKMPGVGMRSAWWWRSNGDGREDSRSTLPGDVFDGLRGGRLYPATELCSYAIREYDGSTEASADLSRFLIGRAREEAGLAPLAWPAPATIPRPA